jgi:tetratricopeptide (TPR) repeat protein
VQAQFDEAMVLLYAFWAKDSIAGFKQVLQQDPECAIAYWGIAMAYQGNPLTAQQPPPEAAREALAALDAAKRIGAKTQRERDYIAAIDLIYRDADNIDFATRRRAYEEAMGALAQRYPDDSEASVFYALSLDMTASLTDKTYANQLKAAAILEKILAEQPQHPGVAHYLIHSYDYPPIAERGVAAAHLYAQLAPNHPHALHMPSHIFTRLGMWQDSIDSNERSAAAAKAEGNGQEQAHAMDYLVYAYLQLGEDAEAQRVVAESASVAVNPAIFIGPYALAAMPARYAVERGVWSDAATLQVHDTKFSFPDAVTHFARGLGFVHISDTASAATEARALGGLRDALRDRKDTYWANQVEVQRLAVEAWIAFARGNRDDALKNMRAAADLEDSMDKHIVTPGAIVPARELLGDMLLDAHYPEEALVAYQASARREPKRLHGLYGAARAAEQTGNKELARSYYSVIVGMSSSRNGTRTEIRQAKAYLATQ